MKLGFLQATTAAVAFSAALGAAPEANAQDFGRIIERSVERGATAVIRDWSAERAQDRKQENTEFNQGIRERDREHRFGVTEASRDGDLRRRLEAQAGQYGMRSQYDQNRAAIRSDGFTPQYRDDFSRFAGGAQRQAPAPYQGGVYQGPASQAPAYRVIGEGDTCRTGETRARIIVGGQEATGCLLNMR